MMVKTKAYGEFGSGSGKRRKRNNNINNINSTSTTSKRLLSVGIGSYCMNANGQQRRPLVGLLKRLSSLSIPAASSTSLMSSARWPEKLDQPLAVEGSSAAESSSKWLITKRRLMSGVRKKSFTSLTPFAFPKVKPSKQPFFNYKPCNVSHVPPAPLARGNLKFLFEKQLQRSDVSSLKRVILPKYGAENYLPTLESKEGFFIWMDDMDGEHVWKFKFRYWPNNASRMYVLENTGDFTDEHHLEEGDHIMFYQDCDSSGFVVQAKKDDAKKDPDIDYEVQDSSSDVSDDDTSDNDLPCETTSPLEQKQNGVINYFVYGDGCSSKIDSNKLKMKNVVEDISPYCPSLALDEGEGGDDDIAKYLCLEGSESYKNSVIVGTGALSSEKQALIKQDEKCEEVAHEDKGTSNNQLDNANKVANDFLPIEQAIGLKGGQVATTPAKAFEFLDNFLLCAPGQNGACLDEVTLKVDEWGMPYGYETSLTNDPSFDVWRTGGL